jgi:hypothetical protein
MPSSGLSIEDCFPSPTLLSASTSTITAPTHLTVLSSLDESASSQLVKRLLNAQKKECVKRLQRWEEVVVLVAEDERSRIVLDQNDEVHVNGFSKMKPGNQKQLVRCFLHDRRQRQRFPSFINQVCQSKADSSYFETTFAEELSLFWLEKDDINRARYFNELSKDNIRLVKARSVEENKEEFFCAVDNCMLVKEAIAFVEENRPAENWLSTDAICSLLTLEGRRGRHCDEGLVLDRFLAKRTVVDFLIAKFSAFDCSVLQSVRCINQVKFADFCLSRGDTQRAEDTLSAVEFPILLANGRHLLDFAEVNARLRLQQLRLGHRGGVDRNGPADSFLTTVAHSTRNSEVSLGLKCQNYRLQLGTWDFDKVECSKDTLKGILADVRESAGQVEWTDSKWREFPIVFELTGRLAKGLIQQAIAGEKQDGGGQSHRDVLRFDEQAFRLDGCGVSQPQNAVHLQNRQTLSSVFGNPLFVLPRQGGSVSSLWVGPAIPEFAPEGVGVF